MRSRKFRRADFPGFAIAIVRINATFLTAEFMMAQRTFHPRDATETPVTIQPTETRIKFRRIEILYYCGNGAVRNFIWSNVHTRLTTNITTEKRKNERERAREINDDKTTKRTRSEKELKARGTASLIWAFFDIKYFLQIRRIKKNHWESLPLSNFQKWFFSFPSCSTKKT